MDTSTNRVRRVYFHTFGCRANQYDTERTRQYLERCGSVSVENPADADAVVVNSCTVTSNADSELRKYIRGVSRRFPGGLPVVVTGCATAVAGAAIGELGGVTAVVPGQDPQAVAGALGLRVRVGSPRPSDGLEGSERRTRAWLKIQDGCDLACSYCLIRVARGRSRSRRPDDIVAEARRLAEHHPEISLTGIHIGLYGKDRVPRISLTALLERLLANTSNVRFRIGSLECNQLSQSVIDLMANSEGRVAPHLHVPLQSGSDAVLRRMRRAYPSRRYRERVERLAEQVEPLGLGTDVIVGFPGESEADHRRTVRLIEALPFTYVHVFPYSDRAGTDASGLPDAVPPERKAARSLEIRERVRAKAEAHRRERVGSGARVVLEGDELATAVTGDYLKMPASDSLRAGGERLQLARIILAQTGELRADACASLV